MLVVSHVLLLAGEQETHHEMRIPEHDVTCYLFSYLRLSTDNLSTGIASGLMNIYG